MTAKDVLELREQGRIEEAYEAIRQLYAKDKGQDNSLAMFWTATDVLKLRVQECKTEEAEKILLALKRMLPQISNNKSVLEAFEKCQSLLNNNKHGVSCKDSANHIEMGKWGESIAVAFLRDKGYTIIDRDWHSGHRDIDIIARDEDCIVFVEVKTRKNDDFGNPISAVNYQKRKNIQRAMNHFIKYRKIENAVRFDIITVVGTLECPTPIIQHYIDVSLF